VDRVYDLVSASPQGNFEERLTSTSLAESLVAEDPGNPDYLPLLGRSYQMLGYRYFIGGLCSKSEAALRRAIDALERAHRAAPDDLETGRWLALAQADFGLVLQQIGRHADRARALEQAQVTFKALEERFPSSGRYHLDCAACLAQLGAARIDLGQYHGAETSFREAEQHLAQLAGEDRESVHVRYWLAVAKQGLGRVAMARGCTTAAGSLLREAIAIHEQSSISPLAKRDLLVLAWSYLWFGLAELQAGHRGAVPPLQRKLAEVLQSYKGRVYAGGTMFNQAREFVQIEGLVGTLADFAQSTTLAEQIAAQQRELKVRAEVAAKWSDNPALRFEAERSRVWLAELQEQGGQLKAAWSSLQSTCPLLVKLAEAEPENLRRRQGLARAWETLGRVHARGGRMDEARMAANEAVTIAEELARLDTAYLYDLACMLGQRGKLASSEVDAKAAITALDRARKAGFDNEYLLRTDPRLNGLRSRAEFSGMIGKSS
jgi:tetratricopeptide (TPR) repeat protein